MYLARQLRIGESEEDSTGQGCRCMGGVGCGPKHSTDTVGL